MSDAPAVQSISVQTFAVHSPRPARQLQLQPLAPRLDTLAGKTVAQLWDYIFRGDEIFLMLEEALKAARPREIAPERAAGKPERSRIVKAANVQIATGLVGGAAAIAANVAPAIEQAETANSLLKRLFDLLNFDMLLGPGLPWLMGALCAIVILYAVITRMARVEDHQTGRTP